MVEVNGHKIKSDDDSQAQKEFESTRDQYGDLVLKKRIGKKSKKKKHPKLVEKTVIYPKRKKHV